MSVENQTTDPAGSADEIDEELEEEIEEEVEQATRFALLASLATVAILVILVLTINPLRDAAGDALSGDTTSLREDIQDLGAVGVLIVLLLALAHSVIFYPAEILDAAAGFVYGFWFALPLVMFGWMINAIICHQIGRHAARPVLVKMLGAERFTRYEGIVERGGATLLIAMRLIPIVPFSAFSYVAGSARVPLGLFLWTTFVGYIPITVLFVLLGSRLEELSPTDPVIWIGAIVLVALLLITRKVMPMMGLERD